MKPKRQLTSAQLREMEARGSKVRRPEVEYVPPAEVTDAQVPPAPEVPQDNDALLEVARAMVTSTMATEAAVKQSISSTGGFIQELTDALQTALSENARRPTPVPYELTIVRNKQTGLVDKMRLDPVLPQVH